MGANKDELAAIAQTRAKEIGERVARIRLSRNMRQGDLAREAGVSISTLRRLEAGSNATLDAFIRVLQALRLGDHLASLLPDPTVRPVERVKMRGHERQRARGNRSIKPASEWAWGDDEESDGSRTEGTPGDNGDEE